MNIVAPILVVAAVVTILAYVTVSTLADNRRSTCQALNNDRSALRGILTQGQTAAQRNPLPPGLTPDQTAYYQQQRAAGAAFYADALAKLAPLSC